MLQHNDDGADNDIAAIVMISIMIMFLILIMVIVMMMMRMTMSMLKMIILNGDVSHEQAGSDGDNDAAKVTRFLFTTTK